MDNDQLRDMSLDGPTDDQSQFSQTHDENSMRPESKVDDESHSALDDSSSQLSSQAQQSSQTTAGHPQQLIQTESIWSKMTEEELNRYEMFRRSTFPKASIKRLMQSMTGGAISQNVVIAMSGMAKVFVGELVEEATRIQKRYGESGPIEPKHLREAHRVIKHRHDKSVKVY